MITGSTESTRRSTRRVAAALVRQRADDRRVTGRFGPQVAWPIVPIHAVLTPDGRVLTYGTDQRGSQTGYYDYDVWDPRPARSRSHLTLPNETGTDLFCSAQIVLPDGNVELYGGDIVGPGNDYNRDVNQFDPAHEPRSPAPAQMLLKRWYATSTVLPNGEVLLQGGWGQGYDREPGRVIEFPEVRSTDGTFRALDAARDHWDLELLPAQLRRPRRNRVRHRRRQDVPHRSGRRRVDRAARHVPRRRTGARTSTAVMFRPGKILQAGGGDRPLPRHARGERHRHQRRRTGSDPAAPTHFGRHWGTGTVMADGRVLRVGRERGQQHRRPTSPTPRRSSTPTPTPGRQRRRRRGCVSTTRRRCCSPMPR